MKESVMYMMMGFRDKEANMPPINVEFHYLLSIVIGALVLLIRTTSSISEFTTQRDGAILRSCKHSSLSYRGVTSYQQGFTSLILCLLTKNQQAQPQRVLHLCILLHRVFHKRFTREPLTPKRRVSEARSQQAYYQNALLLLFPLFWLNKACCHNNYTCLQYIKLDSPQIVYDLLETLRLRWSATHLS